MFKLVKDSLRKPYHSIKEILRPMPSNLLNFEHNRELWNRYARSWNKATVPIDVVEEVRENDRQSYLQHLGDEWGRPRDVDRIVADYIYPYISEESIVAEIGSGGGRIASRVAGRTRELYCFDIAAEMLKRAKAALRSHSNVHYILLDQPKFPDRFAGKFDFLYSFDVFVHLDLHTIWKYFNEIRTVLREGGKAFVHTTNLKAPKGWEWFSSQDTYSVGGGYFVCPEIIDVLAQHSNLRIVKRSSIDPSNFYLGRDYLVVLEKP